MGKTGKLNLRLLLEFVVFMALAFAAGVICVKSCRAQTDNTIYVKQFPGITVGQKVTAAMATCTTYTSVPCILVLDPSLAAYATGTMPTLCSHCYLWDFRTGPPSGGGMVFPPGAGIPLYAGANAWGSSYNSLNPIPEADGGTGRASWTGGGLVYSQNPGTLQNVGNFIYIAPSADTTGGTDGGAIQTACAAGETVQLGPGTYYVGKSNSTITVSAHCTILGWGQGSTVIQNEGTTNNVFTVNVNNGTGGAAAARAPATRFTNFRVQQDPGVTPTAGYAFTVGIGNVSTGYTSNVFIDHVDMINTCGGATFVPGALLDWLEDAEIIGGTCRGLYINSQSPGGDLFIHHVLVGDDASDLVGIEINQSDVIEFDHVKLNANYIKFDGGGLTDRVTFDDLSIEGVGSMPCSIDFGSTGTIPQQIEINGGKFDNATVTALCHPFRTNLLHGWFNDATADPVTGRVDLGLNGPNTNSDNFGAQLNPIWWTPAFTFGTQPVGTFTPFNINATGVGMTCDSATHTCASLWQASTLPANQSAYLSYFINSGGGGFFGVFLRMSTAATGYAAECGGTGSCTINKCVSNSCTTLTTWSSSAFNNGDYIWMSASGTSSTVLNLYYNCTPSGAGGCTPVATATDSSSPITSGQPGFWIADNSSVAYVGNFKTTSP